MVDKAEVVVKEPVAVPKIDVGALQMLLSVEEKIRAHANLKPLHEAVMRALGVHSADAELQLVEIRKGEAEKAQADARAKADAIEAAAAKARVEAANLAKFQAEADAKADAEKAKKAPPPDGGVTVQNNRAD